MSSRERSEPPTQDEDILDTVDRAIAMLESYPDPAVRERVTAMLEGIDAVHRAGLTHLVEAVRGMAGDAFLNRLLADPAIRLLLMSYNLIAVDRRLQAEEALDAVRGHLHENGVDVEIVEVTGGVVYVRLHQAHTMAERPPLEAIRRDLERALRAGFIGFQELVVRERGDAPAGSPQLITFHGRRPVNRPVCYDAMSIDAVPAGTMRPALVHDVPVLVVNVAGEMYAIRNRCGDGPLPLEFSTLSEAELCCSWHGCRYDVRTGRRIDADAPRVQTYPVSIENGRVLVALGVEPVEAR